MDDKKRHQELKREIDNKHFVRAAHIAALIGLNNEELKKIRSNALYQMSALHRNAMGTKILAKQYGFSEKKLRYILEHYATENRKEGKSKPLGPCYDYNTGKYLSFEEWMDHYLKN